MWVWIVSVARGAIHSKTAASAIRSKLIEHVGGRIMDKLKAEFPQLINTEVKIIKLSPPMNGNVERVSVVIKG